MAACMNARYRGHSTGTLFASPARVFIAVAFQSETTAAFSAGAAAVAALAAVADSGAASTTATPKPSSRRRHTRMVSFMTLPPKLAAAAGRAAARPARLYCDPVPAAGEDAIRRLTDAVGPPSPLEPACRRRRGDRALFRARRATESIARQVRLPGGRDTCLTVTVRANDRLTAQRPGSRAR